MKNYLLSLFIISTLTACGGGGGSSSDDSGDNNEPRDPPIENPDDPDNNDGNTDNTPDNLPTDLIKSGVDLDALIESELISITGINTELSISVSGGEFKIGNGNYTSSPATVSNGDQLQFRVKASDQYNTVSSMQIVIGNHNVQFKVTTKEPLPVDEELPSLVSSIDVDTGERITFDSITLVGLANNTILSIDKDFNSNVAYTLNGGPMSVDNAPVNNGDVLKVFMLSSADANTEVQGKIKLNEQAIIFSVITGEDDDTPFEMDNLIFEGLEVNQEVITSDLLIEGINTDTAIKVVHAEYSINGEAFTTQAGTFSPNDSVRIKAIASSAFSAKTTSTVTLGKYSSFDIELYTRAADATPDELNAEYLNVVGADPGVYVETESFTVSGVDQTVSLTGQNVTISTNGGPYSSANYNLKNGDTFRLRVLSSSNYLQSSQFKFDYGTFKDLVLSVTTRAIDTVPDTFGEQLNDNVELDEWVYFEPLTVTGIDPSVSLSTSIEGGQYSINATNSYTDEASTVESGDQIRIRIKSSASFSTVTEGKLIIDGLETALITKTRERDVIPDSLETDDRLMMPDTPVSTQVMAGPYILSGFDGELQLTVPAGFYYSINDSEITSEASLVSVGDTLRFYVTTHEGYREDSNPIYPTWGIYKIGDSYEFEFSYWNMIDQAPTITETSFPLLESGKLIQADEALTITFSEPMQPEALYEHSASLTDGLTVEETWNEDKTELTLTANADWRVGKQSLKLKIQGDGDKNYDETIWVNVIPVFETYQAASVVIGQTNMTNDDEPNEDSINLSNMNHPTYLSYDEDFGLLITDSQHNRVLHFKDVPSSNGQSADDFFGPDSPNSNDSGTDEASLNAPHSAMYFDGKVMISDTQNNRVLFVDVPESGLLQDAVASTVIGQDNFNTNDKKCSANGMDLPHGLYAVNRGGNLHWLVSDRYNRRISLWNSLPEQNVDSSLVLGQTDKDTCEYNDENALSGLATTSYSNGIWTDGEMIISVAPHRLLFWNQWPTETGESASFQLGQDNSYADAGPNRYRGKWNTGADGFDRPTGINSNGTQLCVADRENNRVLIWNAMPTDSDALPDVVLGQESFTDNILLNTSRRFFEPKHCLFVDDKILVADSRNNRVLIFNALNSSDALNK